MTSEFIQCPKCDQAQFQEWVFENQKFPFKSCKDCREQAKQQIKEMNDGYPEGGGSGKSNNEPLLDALRKTYQKMDELQGDFLAKYTDMQLKLDDAIDRIEDIKKKLE